MTAPPASVIRDLTDRQQIAELVNRRGRAADAKDPAAILIEHEPGTRDVHGIFDGTIEEFVDHLRTHNYQDPRYGLQRHTVSNLLIDFESATRAVAESYHLAYHRLRLSDHSYDVQVGGRYLDRCHRVGGRWLLSSRTVVYDWSRSRPAATATPEET